MTVRLIATTKPVLDELTSAEDIIVYCARVSNPNNQLNTETGPKLLKYCLDHGHVSVFEQASMTVEIKTFRAVAAQILRHCSFRFQEFSQRYSGVTEYPEIIAGRKQGKTNRQVGDEELEDDSQVKWQLLQEAAYKSAYKDYRYAIKLGVAREQARLLLPLATPTTLYMTGNARSWIHYLQIRTSLDTQREHREIALKIMSIFCGEFPNISKALGWNADKEDVAFALLNPEE